ncbi:MAG: hypothetical protein M0P11_03285 [Anaerolineaceae bacterium]|jgi:hypothetical protein|nr:hypothetical protein [Anaerolineaceae bacterium]
MEKLSIGQSISQSVMILDKAWKEIIALIPRIQEEVENLLDDTKTKFNYKEGWNTPWDYTEEISEIVSGTIFSLGIYKGSKTTVNRYINFQISLFGECIGKNGEPLLHISLEGDPGDFEFNYMGLDLDDSLELPICIREDVLLDWEPEGTVWHDQWWTYSLYLTSINEMEDIEAKIIKPLRHFLKNEKAEAIGKLMATPGIVTYKTCPDDNARLLVTNNVMP